MRFQIALTSEHVTTFRWVAFSELGDLTAKKIQERMTFKVMQGQCCCCHLIGYIQFLLVFHCQYISVLHRFRDINTYLPRRHVTLTTPLGGYFVVTTLILRGAKLVHKIWRFYHSTITEKFMGCKILKWITWPRLRPFQRWSVVRRQTLDIACKHKKWRPTFSRSRDIPGVWNSRMRHVALTTPT